MWRHGALKPAAAPCVPSVGVRRSVSDGVRYERFIASGCRFEWLCARNRSNLTQGIDKGIFSGLRQLGTAMRSQIWNARRLLLVAVIAGFVAFISAHLANGDERFEADVGDVRDLIKNGCSVSNENAHAVACLAARQTDLQEDLTRVTGTAKYDRWRVRVAPDVASRTWRVTVTSKGPTVPSYQCVLGFSGAERISIEGERLICRFNK